MSSFFEKESWIDSLTGRKQAILFPKDFPKDRELQETYRTARALDRDLLQFFNSQDLSFYPSEIEQGISNILQAFKSHILRSLKNEKQKTNNLKPRKFKNIFEFAGCKKLYLSNKYTRIISERLGHQFEKIASLSPCVMIPEVTLNLKLKGIDAIFYLDRQIYYTQIKTKRDTLTGSQVTRTLNELKIHPNSLFVAALDMGKSTNPSLTIAQREGITLLVGEQFWSKIGIEYAKMLQQVCEILRGIEATIYPN
jgi:hypothetical protein